MAYIWWFDKCHTKLGQSSDKEGHTHIFTKVLMGFAWDTHTYKDQKSQWHIYGGLINVTQSLANPRTRRGGFLLRILLRVGWVLHRVLHKA